MDIITPKNVQFVNTSTQLFNSSLEGLHMIIHVGNTKLTCCCEFNGMVICGGFSGELFFVKDMRIVSVVNVSNYIIRSVIPFLDNLIITTDGGEIILFNGSKIIYVVNSDSPVYKAHIIDDITFLTCERSGAIKEWYYISNRIINNRTIGLADGSIFAVSLLYDEIIAIGSKGKKYVYDTKTKRHFDSTLASCNIFCLGEGKNSEIYYGLANGEILCEKDYETKKLVAHSDAVRDIAFSSGKQWMFSVSKDNSVRAWREGIPYILSMAKDYLYQIIVGTNYVCYVDGHGDLGRIDFNGDIDHAKKLIVKEREK